MSFISHFILVWQNGVLDGIEVCLRIRQWSRIPIIMLTTWGAGEGKVRGLNLGADGYLTEPFGIDELTARIKEVLRRNLAYASLLANIAQVHNAGIAS